MAGKSEDENTLPAEFIEAVNRRAEEDKASEPEIAPVVAETEHEETGSAPVETPQPETPVVADPATTQPTADEQSGDGEAAPTISPELAEMARRYGLSDEDVAEFTPDELKRATKLLDREAARLLKAQGQRPVQMQAPPPVRPDAGTPGSEATNPPNAANTPEVPVQTIDQKIQALRDKGWDEDILALHRETLEQNLSLAKQVSHMDGYLRHRSNAEMQGQQQMQVRAQQAHTGMMLQGIDTLKRSDLFGSSDKPPTDDQARNLAAMREHIEVLQRIQHQRGINPALTSELVERAYEIAFSKQLQHEAAKNKAKAVIKQSRTTMGQGRKATVPSKSIPVDEGNVASHPRIKEFFAAIKAESA